MTDQKEHLVLIFDNLIRMKNECSCSIFSACEISDITVKQINYLKVIDSHDEITFSRLAEITRNSKPTITEMIHKLDRMGCISRKSCPHDGRISYLYLTERGEMIARAEQNALQQVIERLIDSLDCHEIDLLIEILKKVR
ncbi:MAG: MarR family winged helix-turn-helix transcriptional regulator [Methanospirillum sp.]|uniref:MarR family winged helix-turn-helix transcriptional regulator n=1 Tax=Methanospirillum sp. TaxID=45200 RepID=UPI00236FE25A|nr:MarR family winged helix-turn-helix transcriptional regulator [Methanospirillum sp.]MDD1730362.1 MarR family winged helix-turn-helix transcriptional regulator [Methanospirillum sp.]